MSAKEVQSESAAVRPFGLTARAVILDQDGRTLLVRRSKSNRSFVGCWEWPGGKVDSGEDFATATVREAREELGLDIALTRLAGATTFEMPETNVVMLCMEARIIGGDLALSEEHDAAEWVPLAELARWNLPPHHKEFMLEYAAKTAHARR